MPHARVFACTLHLSCGTRQDSFALAAWMAGCEALVSVFLAIPRPPCNARGPYAPSMQVLHNPDDCFCVVLKALFPTQTGHAPSVLFSGYVVLQQIRTYLADKLAARSNALIPTLLRKLLAPSSQGPSGPALQWHSVCMRGPGGVGLADVAVCRVSASAARLQTDASEKGDSGNGALQGSKQGDSSSQSLQCALVSLSMPVGALARDILSGSVPQSNTG